MMSPLRDDLRRALVALARAAVTEAVLHRRPLDSFEVSEELPPAGVFVTLRREGRLRGCVGRLSVSDPLAISLAACGYAAALEDDRFPPVAPEELPAIEIEVSLLSAPVPAAPDGVEVGRHGVRVSRSGRQAVLLPQVPVELGWDRERFLAETCAKAGLPRDAWREPETRIEVFTTEVLSEAEFAAAGHAPHDRSRG